MYLVTSMTEIESDYIHASFTQFANHFDRIGFGTYRQIHVASDRVPIVAMMLVRR